MTAFWSKILFIVAGVYDGLLGAAFLFFSPELFRISGVTPPNHFGYIHFPALLLITFAVMFFQVARDPIRYRELIPYGMALKASYAGVAFWHDLHGGIPKLWLPWAWADLVFLILFFVVWKQAARK